MAYRYYRPLVVCFMCLFTLSCVHIYICTCSPVIHRFKRVVQEPEKYQAKNGKSCIKCQPGTYWISDCQQDGQTANCKSCPDGYFQKVQNIATSCEECLTLCNKNFVLNKTCTSTTNNGCYCKEGYYLLKLHGENEEKCLPNPPCPPGQGIETKGTSSGQVSCVSCPDGTFSDLNSSTQRCRNYTKCINGTIREGPTSKTSDVKCVSDPGSSEHNNTGAIVAGVLVPLILIIVVAVIIIIILQRKEKYCFKKDSQPDGKELDPMKKAKDEFDNVGNGSGNATSTPNGTEKYSSVPTGGSPVARTKKMDGAALATFLSVKLLTDSINMKFCLRHMIVESGISDADAMLNESEENHPRNVKEMLYQSVLKWTEVAGRNVTADIVLRSLQKHKSYRKVADEFKEKFKEYLKDS